MAGQSLSRRQAALRRLIEKAGDAADAPIPDNREIRALDRRAVRRNFSKRGERGPVTLRGSPFLDRLSAPDNVIHDDRHVIVWQSLAPILTVFARNRIQVRARDLLNSADRHAWPGRAI
jgi:hypothetical protein